MCGESGLKWASAVTSLCSPCRPDGRHDQSAAVADGAEFELRGEDIQLGELGGGRRLDGRGGGARVGRPGGSAQRDGQRGRRDCGSCFHISFSSLAGAGAASERPNLRHPNRLIRERKLLCKAGRPPVRMYSARWRRGECLACGGFWTGVISTGTNSLTNLPLSASYRRTFPSKPATATCCRPAGNRLRKSGRQCPGNSWSRVPFSVS